MIKYLYSEESWTSLNTVHWFDVDGAEYGIVGNQTGLGVVDNKGRYIAPEIAEPLIARLDASDWNLFLVNGNGALQLEAPKTGMSSLDVYALCSNADTAIGATDTSLEPRPFYWRGHVIPAFHVWGPDNAKY